MPHAAHSFETIRPACSGFPAASLSKSSTDEQGLACSVGVGSGIFVDGTAVCVGSGVFVGGIGVGVGSGALVGDLGVGSGVLVGGRVGSITGGLGGLGTGVFSGDDGSPDIGGNSLDLSGISSSEKFVTASVRTDATQPTCLG